MKLIGRTLAVLSDTSTCTCPVSSDCLVRMARVARRAQRTLCRYPRWPELVGLTHSLTTYILIVNNNIGNIVGVSVANIVARSTQGADNIQQHHATIVIGLLALFA